MSESRLASTLRVVDWPTLVETFLKNTDEVTRVEASVRHIALWSKQFESADSANPALCFVREMQVQSHYVATLLALALYKPAASALRAMVESGLYYSYFRTHFVELGTLGRVPRYYTSRSEIEEYHKLHTPDFSEKEAAMGLLSSLTTWYSRISAIVHGQLPGAWVGHKDLAALRHEDAIRAEVILRLEEARNIVRDLFLCTVEPDLWNGFSKDSRQEILKGITREKKAVLRLSIA